MAGERFAYLGGVEEGQQVLRALLQVGWRPALILALENEVLASLSGGHPWLPQDWDRIPLVKVSSFQSPQAMLALGEAHCQGVLAVGISEILRAGIQSIHGGQTQAAYSIGLTHRQAMRYVVLPQAFRRMVPALVNEGVTLVKDSSLVSVISVAELMWAAQSLASVTLRPVEILTGTGLLYVAVAYPLSLGVELVRRRYLAT